MREILLCKNHRQRHERYTPIVLPSSISTPQLLGEMQGQTLLSTPRSSRDSRLSLRQVQTTAILLISMVRAMPRCCGVVGFESTRTPRRVFGENVSKLGRLKRWICWTTMTHPMIREGFTRSLSPFSKQETELMPAPSLQFCSSPWKISQPNR